MRPAGRAARARLRSFSAASRAPAGSGAARGCRRRFGTPRTARRTRGGTPRRSVVERRENGDHRRRRGREELPELLAGARVDPERAVVEVELEVLAEHVLDVILAAPLVRLAAVDRLVGEAAVELAELRVRPPRGEAEPARPDARRARARPRRSRGRRVDEPEVRRERRRRYASS